jgi:hypothetical protein
MSDFDSSSDPFDRLLAASLARRPEAEPIADLAQRAIARAAALDRLAAQQKRALFIQRLRLRVVYTFAALLIGVLLFVGGKRLLAQQQTLLGTEDSTTTVSTDSSWTTITASTSTYVLWIGGLFFIVAIAGVAAESSLRSDRIGVIA